MAADQPPLEPCLEITEIIDELGGATMYKCAQCGQCTALCPWSPLTGYSNRKLNSLAQLGAEGVFVGARTFGCAGAEVGDATCTSKGQIVCKVACKVAGAGADVVAGEVLDEHVSEIVDEAVGTVKRSDSGERAGVGVDVGGGGGEDASVANVFGEALSGC